MNENIIPIIITSLTVLFGAGAWKFYEFLIKNKREKEKETLKESTAYRDDLKIRVEKLEVDKDECTDSLMDVKIKLSALEVKVLFLEKENDRLKYR
jgi:predicted nuclease with TOPRIM domain|tara:strand:+ start:160 stop:447 length:288 start_codon:yes stop_codon:yes gene_type:complete